MVLQRLLENKLFVKADKCEFHPPARNFLGNVVGQGQLQLDPTKIRALAHTYFLLTAATFLGFC